MIGLWAAQQFVATYIDAVTTTAHTFRETYVIMPVGFARGVAGLHFRPVDTTTTIRIES